MPEFTFQGLWPVTGRPFRVTVEAEDEASARAKAMEARWGPATILDPVIRSLKYRGLGLVRIALAMSFISAAAAQTPPTLIFTVTKEEMATIGDALQQMPFRAVAPLLNKLQKQIDAQLPKAGVDLPSPTATPAPTGAPPPEDFK